MVIYDIIPPRKPPPARRRYRKKASLLAVLLSLLLILEALPYAFPVTQTKAAGNTYYVDCNAANDTKDGLSPANAWKTIAKVNGSSFSPGDSVLFNKGCTWREQLDLPSLGSTGSPITVGSYGTGAQPVFDGADVQATWTPEAVGAATNFTSDANLQAYWDFENNLNDGTAHGNTLTNNNGATFDNTAGEFKQGSYSAKLVATSSQSLSRTDANLSASFPGKSGTTTTNFTSGTWVYLNSFNSNAVIFSKVVTATASWEVAVSGNGSSGKLQATAALDGTNHTIFTNSNLSTGTWYHVAIRINSATKLFELFINGISQTQKYTATSTTMGVNTNPLRIGVDGNAVYLNGMLDETWVFNRALSDSEISSIYSCGLDGSGCSGFTAYHSNNATYASDPGQAFQIDGSTVTRLNRSNLLALMTTGNWFYDSTNTRAYVRTTADDTPANHVIEVTQRDHGASTVYPHTYVVFDGLHATRALFYGLSAPTVQNSTADYNHDYGIIPAGVQGFTATDNVAAYNGGDGINRQGGTNLAGWLVNQNVVHHNCQLPSSEFANSPCGGIRIGGATLGTGTISDNDVYSQAGGGGGGNGIHLDTNASSGSAPVVERNRVHDNYLYGIQLEACNGCIARYNVAYGQNGLTGVSAGIILSRLDNGSHIYNNSSFGNQIGIQSQGDGSTGGGFVNNDFKNNISYGNATRAFSAILGGQNDGVIGFGNVYTYNALGPESTNFIEWGGGVYKSTYAAFDAAYGSSTHSIAGDPKFTNAAGGDFTLQSISPAIDAGTDLGITYSSGLSPSSTWPSNVVLLDQYANGLGWDLGAYIYTESTPPTVSITAPVDGATVSGNAVNITASASDDSAVYSVQFTLDGVNLGSALTAVPYSFTWNTSAVANGSHTIRAIATDTYGNTASSPAISITVSNGGSGTILPSSFGMTYATPVPSPMPIVSPAENPPSATLLPSPFPSSSAAPSAEPSPVSPPSISESILTAHLVYGSRGEQVTLLQQYLQNLGFLAGSFTPGIFDIPTLKAVKAFQSSQGIYPNGIVGPRTHKALSGEEFITNKDHVFTQDLSYGSRGDEVVQLQTRLRDTNFYPWWLPSTGWFGPVTKEAVRIFQSFANILQTGRLDEATRGVLNVGGK